MAPFDASIETQKPNSNSPHVQTNVLTPIVFWLLEVEGTRLNECEKAVRRGVYGSLVF